MTPVVQKYTEFRHREETAKSTYFFVRVTRILLVFCSVLFVLSALPSSGHEHFDADKPGLGLDEHLGAKIPLDASFLDENGKAVRLSEMVTGPTIILPVYYKCTNVCNFLQGGLARVLPDIKSRPGIDYRVISISFDENETPELASRFKKMYLDSMKVPFPEDGWRFLTGKEDEIRRVTDAAGFHFQRKDHDFIHPVVSLVVSKDGTIVRYLYGTNFLDKDVTLALLEAKEGKVGKTIRTVVGYCFSFDPAGKTYVFNLLRVTATAVILSAGVFLAYLVLSGRKRKQTGGERRSKDTEDS